MLLKAAPLSLALLLTCCTDPIGARRVLTAQGYKDIFVTGYRFYGCDEQDTYRTGFEATSPSYDRVSGVVCRSWSNDAKVRVD